MKQQLIVNETDSVLRPFLEAEDQEIAESLLAELICIHADPLITKIIRNKLRVPLSLAFGSHQNQDALEIAGDVRAQILSELRKLKSDLRRRPVHDFAGYVALKTYSSCADYFREKNPQRRRLRDLLRYHLNEDSKFALWEAEPKRWLCGLRSWADGYSLRSAPDRKVPSSSDLLSLVNRRTVFDTPAAGLTAPDLLSFIFDRAGGPVHFDDLVTTAAVVWNIRDEAAESLSRDDMAKESLADQSTSVEAEVEQRLLLQRLWEEVCKLPPLQRSALLLNLRDARGANVIFFIPHLGIASRAELAETLELSIDELAELWTQLPLDDATIARRLGVTRQQVINLRKTARERLTRRMKAMETRPDR